MGPVFAYEDRPHCFHGMFSRSCEVAIMRILCYFLDDIG